MNYATYQGVLMAIALVGASALTLALALAAIWPYLAAAWDALGRRRMRRVFLAAAAAAALYGGAKHGASRITFPQTDPETWYLRDNGSYVTNGALHVAFTRSPVLPQSAIIYIEGLELSYTNDSDWAEHAFLAYSNTLGNAGTAFDVAWPAATNFNWVVYTDWTPPPTTHTNGVAYATWQRSIDGRTNVIATVKTGIYANWRRVSPNPAITNSPPSSGRSSLLSTLQQEINQ